MPPRNLKESIVFLVNIGVARRGIENDSQLLNRTKFILKHTIQKKIFLRPKDEIGVMLMGSGVDSVEELCKMQIADWDLIEKIEKLKPTDQSCSWMEALYTAVAYIKHECVNKSERKIFLFSNFNEEEEIVNQFQVDEIAEELSSEEILLIAVGERALDNLDEDSLTASEALLMKVLQKIGGQYLTFELVMSDVRFYKRPSTKPMPWYCHMTLGNFSIPIAGISKMPNEVKFPGIVLEASTSDVPDEQVPIKNVAQWTDNSRTVHTEEDTMSGYVYGGKAIPVSDESKTNMTHITTEKCYKIHGFTAKENIPMEFWLSDGSYVIVPANESVSAPFYSLVRAMVNKNVVAIVEKVYRTNSEANMVALFPSIDVPNEPWCLIEIGLPFEQDYEAITPRPLKFVMRQLSKDQSDAIDDLLESLELPDTDDDTNNISERYLPGYMSDPGAQNMWDMLSARALNPDKPLPPVADEVKNLLEQPEFVKKRCEPVADRIKDLFSLEKKKPLRTKTHGRSNEDTQTDNNGAVTQQSVKGEKTDFEKDKIEELKNADVSTLCRFDFDEIADL